MGEFLLRQRHLFVLSIKRYCFFSLHSYSGSTTSRVIFFFSTSLCRFLFPYCSNGNIDLLSIPKDTRIKIHLAFVGIVAAVDPFHHHHVCPPPNDPINHPSDTVYLFYVFLLWVMEEHLLRSSTTQISSPLLFFR